MLLALRKWQQSLIVRRRAHLHKSPTAEAQTPMSWLRILQAMCPMLSLHQLTKTAKGAEAAGYDAPTSSVYCQLQLVTIVCVSPELSNKSLHVDPSLPYCSRSLGLMCEQLQLAHISYQLATVFTLAMQLARLLTVQGSKGAAVHRSPQPKGKSRNQAGSNTSNSDMVTLQQQYTQARSQLAMSAAQLAQAQQNFQNIQI